MGHVHWSLDCACCSAMGIKVRGTTGAPPAAMDAHKQTRISTGGMEDLYFEPEPVHEIAVEVETIEVSDSPPGADNTALLAVIRSQSARLTEQAAKLEAAGFRMGYLEGLVAARETELKQLPDLRARAASAIVSELQAQEMANLVQQLEGELGHIKGLWWVKLIGWLAGKRL